MKMGRRADFAARAAGGIFVEKLRARDCAYWTLPQGVWEVVLFSTGAAVMWFFSLFSVFEVRSKLKKQLKEKDEKIAALEQEKKAILDSVTVKQQAAEAAEQKSGEQRTETAE